MQADLKSLLRAHLGRLAGEAAALPAIGEWISAAAGERARLLDEFKRRARAHPATKAQVIQPPPRSRVKDPIPGD